MNTRVIGVLGGVHKCPSPLVLSPSRAEESPLSLGKGEGTPAAACRLATAGQGEGFS